jgi:hypothetical protein
MIINTQLDIAHKELMIIFFKANELTGVVINEFPIEIRGRYHMMLQFEVTYEPTEISLTFMGLRHCGVLNMFDDYLLKCGIEVSALQPKSYHRQLQDEREKEINDEFVDKLQSIVSTNGKINEYLNQ